MYSLLRYGQQYHVLSNIAHATRRKNVCGLASKATVVISLAWTAVILTDHTVIES